MIVSVLYFIIFAKKVNISICMNPDAIFVFVNQSCVKTVAVLSLNITCA